VQEAKDRTTLVCECKWGRGKTGMEAVEALRLHAKEYPNLEQNTVERVLVVAGGVTDPVRKEKDVLRVGLEDFFR
jgi:hypothetical protein